MDSLLRRLIMKTSPNDRERVYTSLPGDRRKIVQKTGLPSYGIPAVLKWLKRRGLAHNGRKGIWEPTKIPAEFEICWKHGILKLGDFCPACPPRDRV
jgi:hypothetical protein